MPARLKLTGQQGTSAIDLLYWRRGKMKDNKLTAAVISAGMIANKAHIPAYLNLKDKVELLAVCDMNEAVAKATAERFGIPHYYKDAKKMLEELRPDLVSVCTPNASHKYLAAMALELGANVACEKPLALTYKDTKELFDLAKQKGRLLFACQTLRYMDEFSVARELADAGDFGKLYYSEVNLIRRRGIPKWGTFHLLETNGGGAFCDLGVHMIDSLLWIMGNPAFEAISGSTASYIGSSESNIVTSLAESGAPAGVFNAREFSPEEFEVEEFAAGSIRLAGGIRVNFKISWAVNLPNEFNMSIAGSKAGLAIPKMEIYSTMGRYQADIKPRIFKQGKYEGKDFSGHYYLMEDAVNYLLGGGTLPVQPEETLNVAAIIDAFYISAKEGREVRAEEVVK